MSMDRDVGKYRTICGELVGIFKDLRAGTPPVNAERAERIMLYVGRARHKLDEVAAMCARNYSDSDVEPGPEGRAAIIDERQVAGVRQITAGPKLTEKEEVLA